MQKLRAITLIEVLIVVAIMGILMAALSVGIRNHLIRANDAERKADIKKISQALEQFYNDHGGYPGSLDPGGPPNSQIVECGNNSVLSPYLSDVPCSPGGGSARPYLYVIDGQPHTGTRGADVYRAYRLLTVLEYKADPQITEVGCPAETGCGGISATAGVDAEAYNFGIAANTSLYQPPAP